MAKFEYETSDFCAPAYSGMDAKLKKFGNDGWELVSVCPTATSEFGVETVTAFFKREIIAN